MNFCQFFNRSMKKMMYGHTYTPTESINVLLGILILLGTAIECITIRPIYLLIKKISASAPALPKIQIPYAELIVSMLTVVAAFLLAIISRDFFIQPISTSWLAYVFGIYLLNIIYLSELFMFAVYQADKNYEEGMQFLLAGLKPYLIIVNFLNHLYNKTTSSCPLKQE